MFVFRLSVMVSKYYAHVTSK